MLVRNFAAADAPRWVEQKKAQKQRRTELYEQTQQRKEQVKARRVSKPRGEKRNEFRSWFIQKKVNDEYMERKARQAGLGWKIHVAVIVERLNVVLPDQEEWEMEFEDLQNQLQQFGKDYPKGLFPSAAEHSAQETHLTRNDDILEYLEKVKGFTPAPRITEADKSGDVRTTGRKLKTSIYLTVQEDSTWKFPTVALKDDEMLLDAAKRAIPEAVGEELEFWCPSNCPVAVEMMAFPTEQQQKEQQYGSKTFFIKVQFDEGKVKTGTQKVTDFAWLDRSEIVERVEKQNGDGAFYKYLL
jgi:large subunit ribosomal protein L46